MRVGCGNGLVNGNGRSIINCAVILDAIYVLRNPLDLGISLPHHSGKPRGRPDQWRDVLTPVQIARIVHERGEQMKRFGYLSLRQSTGD